MVWTSGVIIVDLESPEATVREWPGREMRHRGRGTAWHPQGCQTPRPTPTRTSAHTPAPAAARARPPPTGPSLCHGVGVSVSSRGYTRSCTRLRWPTPVRLEGSGGSVPDGPGLARRPAPGKAGEPSPPTAGQRASSQGGTAASLPSLSAPANNPNPSKPRASSLSATTRQSSSASGTGPCQTRMASRPGCALVGSKLPGPAAGCPGHGRGQAAASTGPRDCRQGTRRGGQGPRQPPPSRAAGLRGLSPAHPPQLGSATAHPSAWISLGRTPSLPCGHPALQPVRQCPSGDWASPAEQPGDKLTSAPPSPDTPRERLHRGATFPPLPLSPFLTAPPTSHGQAWALSCSELCWGHDRSTQRPAGESPGATRTSQQGLSLGIFLVESRMLLSTLQEATPPRSSTSDMARDPTQPGGCPLCPWYSQDLNLL